MLAFSMRSVSLTSLACGVSDSHLPPIPPARALFPGTSQFVHRQNGRENSKNSVFQLHAGQELGIPEGASGSEISSS